jgi:hypothetical protein
MVSNTDTGCDPDSDPDSEDASRLTENEEDEEPTECSRIPLVPPRAQNAGCDQRLVRIPEDHGGTRKGSPAHGVPTPPKSFISG